MPLDYQRARPLLQSGDLPKLFVEELGWEPHRQKLLLRAAGHDFTVEAIAEKRGFIAWLCECADGRLPEHATRLKLDRELTQTSFEHILIFATSDKSRQSWMWVRREPGQPARARTHEYLRGQPGDSLLQKLQQLFVSLEEEEAGISIADIAGRARAAFDVERITKRFYEEFRKQHANFLKFITGIPNKGDHEWYASVMLNRLMFLYFVQRKGFLDGDPDYLRNRLARLKKEHGRDKFYSFYRYFLLRLFHEGLGAKDRKGDLERLIGRVPYLNGGIFDVHKLERPKKEGGYGDDIRIPDKAFEAIFEYFDRWQWHLDERPLRADNEINPDVLGYIFEKYINQKQMGAYYTKEDITGYIGQNTILPFLFDKVAKASGVQSGPGKEALDGIWQLLRDDPDRYIYPAVRHGISWDYQPGHPDQGVPLDKEQPLPKDIAAGLKPPGLKALVPAGAKPGDIPTLVLRRAWNKEAPRTHGLPTETWREAIARRQRCTEVRRKLADGEVRDISAFITLNLDIRRFALDVITRCESPELLAAFWHALAGRPARKSNDKPQLGLTILDPTCGSGAFLFAALNILEPLYEACLDRMDALLCEALASLPPEKRELSPAGHPKLPHGKMAEFTEVLDQVAAHPNERYFIFKTIILHNLYGVDLMEEAVEICKLRLFLKLAAQVEPDDKDKNLGIEPLPDIDFNIRAGNTLVGYATASEVHKCMTQFGDGQMRLGVDDELNSYSRFVEKAELAARAFTLFQRMQTNEGMRAADFRDAKEELNRRLDALREELNRYLATDYGVRIEEEAIPNPKSAFGKWLRSHQPFHWFVEFFGILNSGGFDVIIGNPPYLEVREIDYDVKGFATAESCAVHSMCIERSAALLQRAGTMSMIVPLSLPSTQRMVETQRILESGRSFWLANYAWRPGKLFDTVNRALTVFVTGPAATPATRSTGYQKWTSDNREGLFQRLIYALVPRERQAFWIPKLGDDLEASILAKCLAVNSVVCMFAQRSDHRIYYRTTGGLYWKVFTDFAPAFRLNGKSGQSSRETCFTATKPEYVKPLIAALSSDIFWWWYSISSNLRDLNPYDIQNFRVPDSALSDAELRKLGGRYLHNIKANSFMLVREQKQTGTAETQSFKIQKAKPIIDEIDTVLADHYGFTAEELDFIVNYDIKYRLGRGGEDEE